MIASSKGFSGCAWFIGGVLFGPIALLVVGFMAPAANAASENLVMPSGTARQAQRRKCPYCAELIMPDAKICRFCGQTVEPITPTIHIAALIEQVSSESLTLSAEAYYKHGYELLKSKLLDEAKLDFARALAVSEPNSKWHYAARARLAEMEVNR